MRKTFKIEGLDCAACASKIEEKIRELPGVDEVTVNFITQKFILGAADDKFENVFEEAKKAAKKIEADVEIK